MKRELTDAFAWDRQPAFVVGGGPSLSGFDFGILEGENVIGCNEAFRLGPAICPVTVFSDVNWFRKRKDELYGYVESGGVVVTQCEKLKTCDGDLEWLHVVRRYLDGLHDNGLFFGTNSACSAVNLALIFGASPVYLLGIDCNREKGTNRSHYHDHYEGRQTQDATFEVFVRGWQQLASGLPKVFPGSEIINLNPDSGLNAFPKMRREEVLLASVHEK